jgi:hypothetical protein
LSNVEKSEILTCSQKSFTSEHPFNLFSFAFLSSALPFEGLFSLFVISFLLNSSWHVGPSIKEQSVFGGFQKQKSNLISYQPQKCMHKEV